MTAYNATGSMCGTIRGMAEKHMFRIRMDMDLKDRLQREADFNRRSLNAEILFRLELSLDGPKQGVGEGLAAYEITDGERRMLEKLRRLGGADAGAAAAVIDAFAARSAEPESAPPDAGR